MKKEVLADQIVRIGMECAKRCGIHENHVEDCAMNFMHRTFDLELLSGPTWLGPDETKLTAMAEMYARGYLFRLRKRARKEVSLTGEDGAETTGPAGQLVSRLPGPEEMVLRKQIRELIDGVLPNLTARQKDLYMLCFEREERAIDLQELTGRSAGALREARSCLRARLHKLLVAAGMDEATAASLLNELERLRHLC